MWCVDAGMILYFSCLVGNFLENYNFYYFWSFSSGGFEILRFAVYNEPLMLLFDVCIDPLMLRFAVYINLF